MRTHTFARRCGRPSCGESACATLAFRYAHQQVWLYELSSSPHPSTYDLCQAHADSLTVPLGWSLIDERPAPPETGTAAANGQDGQDGDRYAALSRDLPRLAAQAGRAEAPQREEPPATDPREHPADADVDEGTGAAEPGRRAAGDDRAVAGRGSHDRPWPGGRRH